MAWFWLATKMPVNANAFSKTGMALPQRYIVHIADGNSAAGNVAHWNLVSGGGTVKVSAHFTIEKDGTSYQHVDTDHMAMGMGTSNSGAIQVENIGWSGQALTRSQINGNASLLVWAHYTWGVPLEQSGGPGQPGVGWHSQYLDRKRDGPKAHWGCPGETVLGQLPDIIAQAQAWVDSGEFSFYAP